jgi:hypothetical protein
MSSLVGRAKKELLMRIDATVATERQQHIDQKGPLIDFLGQNRILLHHLFAGSSQADDPKSLLKLPYGDRDFSWGFARGSGR